MGTFTGSDEHGFITPTGLSEGVLADPPGTMPGDGPDTLIDVGGNDFLEGGGGDDFLKGGGGNDELIGGGGNDRLVGDGGRDRLDGGPGADIMEGGPGVDVYFVDELGDVVIEDITEGQSNKDSVRSMVSFTLGPGLQSLTLLGKDVDGTGNTLNNLLWGTGGKNVLKSGSGDDELRGRNGADELIGGKGSDQLYGDGGEDRLTGGSGNDAFHYFALKGGGDLVTDFRNRSGNDDRFVFMASKLGLEAGGHLSREHFQIGANHEAQDAEVRFIFRTTDQTLWFDRNGSDEGGLTLIADLQANAHLQADDIWLT